MRILATALLFTSFSSAAVAQVCDPLQPTRPAHAVEEFSGTIRGKVDGLFSRLAGVDAAVEGTYKSVAQNVLNEFPKADKLYMWERILFLQCLLLFQSDEIEQREKLHYVGVLFTKVGEDPPTVSADSGQNLITNEGNCVTAVQGEGNRTTVRIGDC